MLGPRRTPSSRISLRSSGLRLFDYFPRIAAITLGTSDDATAAWPLALKCWPSGSRVLAGAVMPVIFASSVLTFPAMIGQGFFQNNRYFRGMAEKLAYGEPLYTFLYCVGIIFFAYFYVSIVFNPNEVADNMRKYGGFVPGIRPGRRTADYINEILTRITLVGGVYLIFVSLIPQFMITGTHLNHLWGPVGDFFGRLPTWVTNGLGVNFYFGGTSLLIVVGVAMDTIQQIESQLIMRHYEGFTPRSGRIKGRRW